ncbi:MAG: hypothetical protein M1483_03100 [Actinobacteria bacterium]|nr:hypothetical protein [Actinomycetota bacterium]MCL6104612.1 hypothetical protein [Actinomycetota bacterium]
MRNVRLSVSPRTTWHYFPSLFFILISPSLWIIAVVQVLALAERHWWGKWPFLPIPPGYYWRFRMLCMYNDPQRHLSASEVAGYLAWCKVMQNYLKPT